MRWSETVPPGQAARVSPWGILGCGAVFFVALIFGAIALPDFLGMNRRAMSQEIVQNVESIRTAELSYDATYDGYIAVPTPVPRPVSQLDRKMVPFPDDTPFSVLLWRPDGDVRGTYWVEVDGEEFTIHGAIDIDQDGEPRHVILTSSGTKPVELAPGEI